MRIALLEDDQDQADLLQDWLEEDGHSCRIFTSGKDLIRNLKSDSFDALILDWLVPDMDGLEVLNWIRKENHIQIPILFVTVLTNEDEIVTALSAGADDFMSKPVKRREMLARLEAISRRSTPDYLRGVNFTVAPYTVQFESNTILVNDEEVELTQKEFDLAVFLFRRVGQVVSRGHILENVWGATPKMNTRTVDTHVSRIRKKLNLTEDNGWSLVSIYQHGYRLEPV